MRIAGGVWFLLAVVLGLGCSAPTLDLPEHGDAALAVDFEPALVDGAVPPLFRARLRGVPLAGEPWLFRGELSDYYARALKRGEVPSALQDWAVPLRFWREGPDYWLQPVAWLEPEISYTIALTGLGVVRVVVAHPGDERRARRLFPPQGSLQHGVSVVCDLADESWSSPLTLEPGSVPLVAAPGMAGQPGAGCITLQAAGPLTQAVVAPPFVGGALFEPSPWLPEEESIDDAIAQDCSAGEPFFGACLEVLDDRVRVTPIAQDLLFALEQPQRSLLATRAGTRGLLLRGLSANVSLTLSGSVLSSAGKSQVFRRTVSTASVRRHLVLNEVLANPLGPEPDSEWLELVNDSELGASLAGVWLEDSAGHVQLPEVELGPGELALVVGERFPASGPDVPIPKSVRVLRVPSLGARGLSNSGEALLLVGREGVLSRFPLLAAEHPGFSIARRTLDGTDDDPSNFGEQGGPGATPGAPNVFAD